jgi:hypothetical protein
LIPPRDHAAPGTCGKAPVIASNAIGLFQALEGIFARIVASAIRLNAD